jgi:hypothetical protein
MASDLRRQKEGDGRAALYFTLLDKCCRSEQSQASRDFSRVLDLNRYRGVLAVPSISLHLLNNRDTSCMAFPA